MRSVHSFSSLVALLATHPLKSSSHRVKWTKEATRRLWSDTVCGKQCILCT